MTISYFRGTSSWGCDPKITPSIAIWSHRTKSCWEMWRRACALSTWHYSYLFVSSRIEHPTSHKTPPGRILLEQEDSFRFSQWLEGMWEMWSELCHPNTIHKPSSHPVPSGNSACYTLTRGVQQMAFEWGPSLVLYPVLVGFSAVKTCSHRKSEWKASEWQYQ